MVVDKTGLTHGVASQATSQQSDPTLQHDARIIEEMFGAAVLATVAGKSLGSAVRSGGYKIFRDNLLAASGSPKDPIEIMIIEQLAWAHHRVGSLHSQAAASETFEMTEAYSSAAAKLMAEFRRSALALREYRAPIVPQQVTVVKQQNLAAGNQQVAFVEAGASSPAREKTSVDSELGTNNREQLLTHANTDPPFAPASCEQAEPIEAQRLNGRRPATVE